MVIKLVDVDNVGNDCSGTNDCHYVDEKIAVQEHQRLHPQLRSAIFKTMCIHRAGHLQSPFSFFSNGHFHFFYFQTLFFTLLLLTNLLLILMVQLSV
jgi:hypothetical protein